MRILSNYKHKNILRKLFASLNLSTYIQFTFINACTTYNISVYFSETVCLRSCVCLLLLENNL